LYAAFGGVEVKRVVVVLPAWLKMLVLPAWLKMLVLPARNADI